MRKHTEGGVYIAKVMYIAKGNYIEYAKDGINAAKSEHSEYAMQHVRSRGHVTLYTVPGDDKPHYGIRSLNIVRLSHSSYQIVLMAMYDHRYIQKNLSLFK